MKKLYILLLIVVFASVNLSATTYTSAQNGSWMNFTTWSPLGIPIPGDIVIINHAVVLDTSFAYTAGSITVNAGASLIQDMPVRDIWVNGANASFTNNGTTTIRYLLLSLGSFANTGNLNVNAFANYITANNTTTGIIMGVDSLYNDGTFNNNGTVNVMTFYNNNTMNNYGIIQGLTTVVDSMFNAGTFLNDAGALLKADSCMTSNTFINNGIINFNQFTNTGIFTNTNYMSIVDLTNIGTYTNKDSLIGTGSMTNTGIFDNQTNAVISLGVSFLNVDTALHNASFTNNGRFNIGDSYYNFDAVSGTATGNITVQDTSYNSGTMTGSFDFCDATPPATSPFVDINLGTIDPSITYCTVTAVNENKLLNNHILISPNPTNGIVTVDTDKNILIDVYNVLGEKIITTTNTRIDLTNYQKGIYFVLLRDETGNVIKQARIVKQ